MQAGHLGSSATNFGGFMFYLILTLCTTAAMDDCEVRSLNKTATESQCMTVADVYRRTLGPERNYRIECEYQKDE